MGLEGIIKKAKIFGIASIIAFSAAGFTGCLDNEYPRPNPQIEVIDAFPQSEVPKIKTKLQGKKLALALITTSDHNNATKGMEEMFQDNFKELPQYQLYSGRPKKIRDLLNFIRDYSKIKRIDALVLAFHGRRESMNVSLWDNIGIYNAKDIFKGYSQCFSDSAIIILYSCSVGSGKKNLAKVINDVLNRDVIAPKFTLIPETDLPPDKRVGEFALTEDGRVSFDYKDYRIYSELYFKGDMYDKAVAPISYVGVRKNRLKLDAKNDKDSLFLIIKGDKTKNDNNEI